jgi:chemosensory pili system protein ChpC
MADKIPDEVASLLIPMVGRPMLLPNVAVAEIVPWEEPEKQDNAPEWYLGNVSWRGIDIPLVSLELMNDTDVDEAYSGHRIAVLNGVGSTKKDFYAVSVQGLPRLIRVYGEEVSGEEQLSEPAYDMNVLVSGERAMIPDLDYVEKQVESL